MTIFVKQYGYYRTGTNYLLRILEKNCECRVCVNHLGCKHEAPKNWRRWLKNPDKPVFDGLPAAVRNGTVRIVVSVKDPYAWLDSFILYFRHRKRPPRGVISREHMMHRISEFNRLYKTWDRHVSERYGMVVRYEDLLQDFEDRVVQLATKLNIPLRHHPPQNITKRVDPHPHLRSRRFDPSYFLERRYLNALSDEQRLLITEHIDWGLFKKWGYERI